MIQQLKRLQAIDMFRAITMFFMIFVNDVDGVKRIPEWIKHVSKNTDGLGFADIIFPAFLFIVGLSVPFAIRSRLGKGYSKTRVAGYVIVRSLALLIMGFYHINLEEYNNASILPQPVWEIFITLAFFLIWLDYPKQMNHTKRMILQAAGITILIAMALLYKGNNDSLIQMRPHWWGILGLIGWSYLICALIYLYTSENLMALIIALAFFWLFNIANYLHWLGGLKSIHKYVWLVGSGSMPALTIAGVIISIVYSRLGVSKKLFITLLLCGAGMIVLGFIVRPLGGISKIHATDAWVGICTGISILVFALIIYLTDVKNKTNLFSIIKPAGTSTLTCYLIPYFLYAFYELLHIHFPAFLNEGIGGIIRSLLTALAVILIAGRLEKKHLRLKI